MVNNLINEEIKEKTPKKVRLVQTLFRNAARSNLELTSLADSKASILISLNGFILTVIVTASGLQLNNPVMIYPFIGIILTSLITIFCAINAIQPRFKNQFIKKEYLKDEESILYFQDVVSKTPKQYLEESRDIIRSTEATEEHLIKHLYILSSEIKVKYKWLRLAYTTFTLGLAVSGLIVIYSLLKINTQI